MSTRFGLTTDERIPSLRVTTFFSHFTHFLLEERE